MTDPHYTRTAVALHWTIAGLIFAGLFMGWTMTDMDISPRRLKVYNYHKWVGVTVLALALLRLIWKLTHRAPALPAMPAWQRLAARISHGLLYVLMFAVPLAGWIYSNATGYRVVYLGKLPLPNLVERDKELAAAWLPALCRAMSLTTCEGGLSSEELDLAKQLVRRRFAAEADVQRP